MSEPWYLPIPEGLIEDTPDLRDYIGSLPDASGTFSGTFDSAVMEQYWPQPDLLPVEVDTYDKPNLLATAPAGSVLTIDMGGRKWRMTVDHTEHLGGNRWRAWCERPAEIPGPLS